MLHREEYDDAEAEVQARAAVCAMRGKWLWFALARSVGLLRRARKDGKTETDGEQII